jgi:protein involved in polysaccharide export with SLBB domain
VPKELQTVRMRGEVLYPTTARYEEVRGFRNYISRAGGFTESARKGRSYVIYANGDVRRTNKVLFLTFFPKIEPGAEIIVPQKPIRQPIPPQVWVALGTSLATMALVISQVINIYQ